MILALGQSSEDPAASWDRSPRPRSSDCSRSPHDSVLHGIVAAGGPPRSSCRAAVYDHLVRESIVQVLPTGLLPRTTVAWLLGEGRAIQ
eukprot:2186189-Pyramimonas_sp.AAC.1